MSAPLGIILLAVVARPGITQLRTEENRMSVYVIAQGKVEDRGLLDQYVAKVIPTVEPYQGRVVAFDEQLQVLDGAFEHPRTVLIELPSMMSFHPCNDSPEYQEL